MGVKSEMGVKWGKKGRKWWLERLFGARWHGENICQNGGDCLFSAQNGGIFAEKLISVPQFEGYRTEIRFCRKLIIVQKNHVGIIGPQSATNWKLRAAGERKSGAPARGAKELRQGQANDSERCPC